MYEKTFFMSLCDSKFLCSGFRWVIFAPIKSSTTDKWMILVLVSWWFNELADHRVNLPAKSSNSDEQWESLGSLCLPEAAQLAPC